ncbi:hypothetical protein DFS34DRAFT_627616 [Phlyctochytrium arcticum]|nr:hypothetical protein DFS34DRAFT_627616 [Phlyctochytrium arcticum]
MFKSFFQGGPYFELLSAQGSATTIMYCSFQPKSFVRRVYDPYLKGFCYSCEKFGSIVIPKDQKMGAYLTQPNLVLQVYIGFNQPLTIELCITNLENQHYRLFFSTTHTTSKSTALHRTYPLPNLIRSKWLNLCIDIPSFLPEPYRCLHSIRIGGTCRIRRIFTTRQTISDFDNEGCGAGVPSAMEFGSGIESVNQVISRQRLMEDMGLSSKPERSRTAALRALIQPLQHHPHHRQHIPPLPSGRNSRLC